MSLDAKMHLSCGHTMTLQHTACPTCFAEMRSEVERLTRERDSFRNGQDQCQHILDLALDDKLSLLRSGEEVIAGLRADVVAGNESYRKKCEQAQALGTKLDGYSREFERLSAELLAAREALRAFIEAAEECERHVEAQNAHVREVQRAAALSRSGDVEGGRALIRRIDSQPRVWDFGRIVLMLSAALKPARRALSPSPKGTPT